MATTQTADRGTDVRRPGTIGVALDGRAPIAEAVAQAQAAEAAGAGTIWAANHLFLRDPVTTAHAILAATSRIRVALMAMSPYAMHPVQIAMSAAALDELFPGRVVLCLGVGAPGDLAAAGIAAPRPIATLREAIRVCRDALSGATLAQAGSVFQVQGRRLPNPAIHVPVVLAASGPQMLELAGEEADGVLVSAATSIEFIAWCQARVASGEVRRARGGRCGVHAIVYTRIADDPQGARDGIRRTMGFILRGPHHAKNLEAAGTKMDQQRLWDAYRDEDWTSVERLVTDDVLARHAAAGSDAEVRARYDAYRTLSLDELIVGGIDDRVGIERALRAIR